MLVLCCGSRDLDVNRLKQLCHNELSSLPPGTRVIHGDARGADRVAGEVAGWLGFEVHAYPADWKAEPRRAGYLRNLFMLDLKPDLVLAFWDGSSPGTRHTLSEAERRGIKWRIVRVD